MDPLCRHDYPSLKDATSPLEMLDPEQVLQITSSEGEPMVLKIKNKMCIRDRPTTDKEASFADICKENTNETNKIYGTEDVATFLASLGL